MSLEKARQALDDTTFLLGGFRRRAALKELAQSSDPAAAAALVEAVDANSPSAEGARAALTANANSAWSDRLWEVWLGKRQAWLGKVLQQRGAAHRQRASAIGVLSLLKLGQGALPQDALTMAAVASSWRDNDPEVQAAARSFVASLPPRERSIWVEMMLSSREFEVIGQDRAALETVVPFLSATDAKMKSAAQTYCEKHLPFELSVLANLLVGSGHTLPIEREAALAVGAYLTDANATVAAQANAYAQRVFQAQPDFVAALAFKCGRAERVLPNRAMTIEALRLRTDADEVVAAAARAWIGSLPNDQQLNDAIVDDWLRSEDTFLFGLLRDQRRLPSDGGKETLLRLLFGDAPGYRALGDTDGRLLSEALAMANESRRTIVVQTIQESRDSTLADQLRRASLRVQGMDTGLGLRTLLASGDEDRIVDAVREMNGRELFELCRRWLENGRRPKDPKKRAAVERATKALKDQPKIEIEPASALPAGLEDLFENWSSQKPSDEELRRDLQAQDPLVRARALYLGMERGVVDEATVRVKAASVDWPERLVAALRGAHSTADKDHVYWVAACAGEDHGTHAAAVVCGPDEFQRAEALLARLRTTGTPLARRSAGELEALQAFRALEMTGITVFADDSATQKGATEIHADASADEMAAAFGSGKPGKTSSPKGSSVGPNKQERSRR